jgi:hypothetical protein
MIDAETGGRGGNVMARKPDFDFYSPPCWPQGIAREKDAQVAAVTKMGVRKRGK